MLICKMCKKNYDPELVMIPQLKICPDCELCVLDCPYYGLKNCKDYVKEGESCHQITIDKTVSTEDEVRVMEVVKRSLPLS